MISANWGYPTAIRFGAGRISELAEACKAAGMSNPLIVTDPGIVNIPALIDAPSKVLVEAFGAAPVFSDFKPNPTGSNVEAGVKVYRDGGHDGVVAFGGGSALDIGKVIAFYAGQSRPLWDFEDIGDWWTRADADAIAPVIAVPTTAGTGSEVGRAGIITKEDTEDKKIIFHPKMLPATVICDPALTVSMPAKITAGTGMDALSHCLEAFCSPVYHPMSQGIAVEGMRLVRYALPTAVKDGSDIAARGDMMSAAAMGATAFQKGLGGMHALAHPLGAMYDAHHGLLNAVLMPYVLMHNRSAIEDRLGEAAAYLRLPTSDFTGFVDWVLALREEVGIQHTLAEIGIDGARAELVAKKAAADPSAGGNPLPFDEAAAAKVFEAALEGRL